VAKRPETPSNYRSGTDFTMEFGRFRFRFNRRDFRERVEAAAAQVGFIEAGGLDEPEVDELVELVASGELTAAGPLSAHIEEHRATLLGFDDDLVQWLRKLVFRGAWLDQQIKEDLVEPIFTEERGFTYRCSVTSDPIEEMADLPDWSAVGYRTDR